MRKGLFYTALLCVALLTGGCNQDDDIEEIFVSGEWYLVNFYTGIDWGNYNDGARPVYTMPEDLNVINKFTITFSADGTLQGNLENGTYSGRWQANPEDRSVSVTRIEATTRLSGKNKDFIDRLGNAQFYQGDSKMLRLAPAERTTCIQFRH